MLNKNNQSIYVVKISDVKLSHYRADCIMNLDMTLEIKMPQYGVQKHEVFISS